MERKKEMVLPSTYIHEVVATNHNDLEVLTKGSLEVTDGRNTNPVTLFVIPNTRLGYLPEHILDKLCRVSDKLIGGPLGDPPLCGDCVESHESRCGLEL
jgi:hypothetical protein